MGGEELSLQARRVFREAESLVPSLKSQIWNLKFQIPDFEPSALLKPPSYDIYRSSSSPLFSDHCSLMTDHS